jgi:hypothetical protein
MEDPPLHPFYKVFFAGFFFAFLRLFAFLWHALREIIDGIRNTE